MHPPASLLSWRQKGSDGSDVGMGTRGISGTISSAGALLGGGLSASHWSSSAVESRGFKIFSLIVCKWNASNYQSGGTGTWNCSETIRTICDVCWILSCRHDLRPSQLHKTNYPYQIEYVLRMLVWCRRCLGCRQRRNPYPTLKGCLEFQCHAPQTQISDTDTHPLLVAFLWEHHYFYR